VRQIGTIRLLEQWLRVRFHPKDPKELDAIFRGFKKVRNLRQMPAHDTYRDSFNQQHFKNQRLAIAYDIKW
jgi:hypothetical protein